MKRNATLAWAGFFALVAAAIAWGALNDARGNSFRRHAPLLEEIERAEAGLSYTGTRRLTAGETVRLRVTSLAGRKRVEFVTPVAPAGGVPAFFRPSPWKPFVKDAEAAARNYEVAVTGRETVAGRPADIVEVRPHRADRPSYRISADAETRLPLRFLVHREGAPIFEAAFEEVRFAAPAPARAPAPGRTPPLRIVAEAVPAADLPARVDFPVWVPSRLPQGFRPRRAEEVRVELSEGARKALESFPFAASALDGKVAHLTYTDGIAVLSVIQCSAQSELWKFVRRFIPDWKAPPGEKVLVKKFADRMGCAYLFEAGGTAVLVAGNLTPGEIEPLLRSLRKQ